MKRTAAIAMSLMGSAIAQSTTYACNPAHQYPTGKICTEIDGSLTLVTLSTTTAPAATAPVYGAATTASSSVTYACNPAHQYPNGAQCISSAGTLTLVTPSPSTSISAAAASATYACNPAHQYPNGAQCISTAGTLALVTPSTSCSSPVMVTTTTSGAAAPSGTVGGSSNGTTAGITPFAGAAARVGAAGALVMGGVFAVLAL